MEPETQSLEDFLRAAFGDGPPLERLSAVRGLRSLLDDLCGELVEAGRAEDASWAQVGDALGVTRQAARQRYAKPSDAADASDASVTASVKVAGARSTPGWEVRVPGGFRVLEIVRRR